MFCSKCGMKNEDGVQFCGGCGAALIGGQSGEEMYQRQSGREELIAKLQQVLPKMIRIDNTDASIQQKKKEKEMVDKNEKGKFRVGLFLIIYILSLCALEGVLGLLTMIIGSITSHHLYFMDTVYGIIVIPWLIGLIIGTIIVLKKDKRCKEKATRRILELEDEIKVLEQKNETEIRGLFPEIQIVPSNYRYVIAVQYIVESFQNRRADTLKEAINLYEEQLHRWKLENASEQMLTLQRQQMSELNKINANTTVSAIANTITAFNTTK